MNFKLETFKSIITLIITDNKGTKIEEVKFMKKNINDLLNSQKFQEEVAQELGIAIKKKKEK